MARNVTEAQRLPQPPMRGDIEAQARAGWQNWARSNWFAGPLLMLYGLIVVVARGQLLAGDATRYIAYATSLLQGTYVQSGAQQLWVGPGYPLVLAPFTPAGAWLAAGLLNAIFMVGAVLYFHAALRLYVSPGAARLGALAIGLYVPALLWLPLLMAEPLAIFLAAGLVYHGCQALRAPHFQWGHAVAAAFFMGYLALTKILFGYVIEFSLFLALIGYGVWRRHLLRRSLLVCAMALVMTIPYLFYTHTVTGRLNYWGDSGGISLYWMSTPYAGEYGDWFKRLNLEAYPKLAAHHRAFLNGIEPLPGVEQDDLLKQKAWENIRGHPLKFAQNWVANVGRLFFNYPYSYTEQKLSTFVYLLPNAFIVVLGLVSAYLVARRPRALPPELYPLLAFAGLGLAASSVLSAFGRMLLPFVPFVLLAIVVVLARALRLRLDN